MLAFNLPSRPVSHEEAAPPVVHIPQLHNVKLQLPGQTGEPGPPRGYSGTQGGYPGPQPLGSNPIRKEPILTKMFIPCALIHARSRPLLLGQ